MADQKYGRLFTEQDVVSLIEGAYKLGREWPDIEDAPSLSDVLGETRHDCRFPPDEPLFLLRGQDKAAAQAIAAIDAVGGADDYYGCCLDVGAKEDHLTAVRAAADAMREWQHANPDRVKVPDNKGGPPPPNN